MAEQKTKLSKDSSENKAIAALGYVCVLCFVPLLFKKNSPFAQFHGKQGLALFIVEVVSMIMLWTVILTPIGTILLLVCVALSLYGIWLALGEQQKEILGLGWIVQKLNL